MTAATLAVMVMAKQIVPSWPATITAGMLTGLAVATRSSGIITQAYLVGATALCALQAVLAETGPVRPLLARIGIRTLTAADRVANRLCVVALAADWQSVRSLHAHFMRAFTYFANYPAAREMLHWGETIKTNQLPWTYVPAQLVVRLPEGFLVLLAVASLIGLTNGVGLIRAVCRALAGRDLEGLKAAVLVVTRSRQILIVLAAALLPIAFIILRGSTLYNGIRHVLFIIPVLAVIAGYGFARLLPPIGRYASVTAALWGGWCRTLTRTGGLREPSTGGLNGLRPAAWNGLTVARR